MPTQPGPRSDHRSPDQPPAATGGSIAPRVPAAGPTRRRQPVRLLPLALGAAAVAIVVLLLLPPPAGVQAQNAGDGTTPDQATSEERRGNPSFWQAELRGGHYMVRLDRVASVSRHEYVVDGVARVVEVTVATDSSAVARFYYLEPVGTGGALNVGAAAAERAREAADEVSRRATGQGAHQVIKNYPASTHAHTVEYVIPSVLQLDSLYNSLRDAMETGTGRVWVGTGG